jgi:hypothetical protein
MRASKKFGLAAIVGGAAAYAMNRRRQGSALGGYESATSGRRSSSGSGPKEFRTEYHADPDEVRARRTEQSDQFVDVTADSAPLVAAERDALTVPGEDGEGHRRRDQTAGEAAQEIAAAQVRERRNSDELLEDEE